MNMKRTLFFAFLLLNGCGLYAQKVTVITTTENKPWQTAAVRPTDAVCDEAIEINSATVLQPVDGFGGTFTERGWDAMQVLTEAQRLALMQEMFGEEGIHFAIGRTPMGGNDLSLSTYTYNDVPYDWTQRNFSIARDRYILLPFIKLAKQVRPDIVMWASPWTPPYWMKLSEHYSLKSHGINGTNQAHNRLDPNYEVTMNVTSFKMMDGFLRSYAIYQSKYLQEYEREGIHIDILMPQNEVQWEPCWQCCTWRPEDLAIFVERYLGPQLEQDSLTTDLWLGTINYPNPQWVFRFMENAGAARYIKGIGVQWSGMQAMPAIHERMPQMPLMQTEGICGDGDNDWKDMETSWQRIVHCFANGARSYMQWNMVLGDDLQSLFEWRQNALVIIDRKTGQLSRTPEYWLMKHLSHFVQPGASLLKADEKEDLLVFRTQEGNVVAVACNRENNVRNLTLSVDNRNIAVSLKPKSLNTIVL